MIKNNKILAYLYHMIKDNGLLWVIQRTYYEFLRKIKWHNWKFKSRCWKKDEFRLWLKPSISSDPDRYYKYWINNRPLYFFNPKDREKYSITLRNLIGNKECNKLVEKADGIGKGNFSFFSSKNINIGFPPNWFINPVLGVNVGQNLHWNEIPMYSEKTGDLKFVWESGRFAFVYDLVRAYWVSGNSKYPEIFWEIIDSWYENNPPNTGPHWKCGQEISLRTMAWCFGLYGFSDAASTTPQRVSCLIKMIAVQADRVAKDHFYSYLQFNNHSISEGVGLWTVGVLFPDLKKAKYWRNKGCRILEKEAQRLIFKDGAFAQNSFNYHRLMLMDYLYAIQVGIANGYEFSPELKYKIKLAGEFIFNFLDPFSGKVPNYGGNDGALIIPLNNTDYQDFKAIVANIHFLFENTLLWEPGLWAEDLIWFFGPDALQAPLQDSKSVIKHAKSSGYYTLRGDKSWAMIRCLSHHTRPAHADMLHVDIWRQGLNIAVDAGSYLYYHYPWNKKFMSTSYHNTITVDGLDQMERGSRFMWYRWTKAKVRKLIDDESNVFQYFEGEHYGYSRLSEPVVHRRGVLLAGEDTWVIIDDILGVGTHDLTLHWLMPNITVESHIHDKTFNLKIGEDGYCLMMGVLNDRNKAKLEIIEESESSSYLGWQSLFYGSKCRVKSILLKTHGQTPIRFISVFTSNFDDTNLNVERNKIQLNTGTDYLDIGLLQPGGQSIILHCNRLKGEYKNSLHVLDYQA